MENIVHAIPGTRDETNLNFYAITEKMRGLQYPPQGSQKPDGFFLTQNPGESDADFAARQEKGFLCPLDREFIELERRKPDTLAYRLYKEIRNEYHTELGHLSSERYNVMEFANDAALAEIERAFNEYGLSVCFSTFRVEGLDYSGRMMYVYAYVK